MKERTNQLLESMRNKAASTLFLLVNAPPMMEVHGRIQPVSDATQLTPQDTEELAKQMMNRFQWERFNKENSIEFSYSIPNLARYRVSVFRQCGNVGATLRFISPTVPTLAELNLPDKLESFSGLKQGLVVVTGPAGCGKSSTLAAMVALINRQRRLHVITVEDPIEFFFPHEKGIVCQRELGADTYSFAEALHRALRQDPDVIVIGEMRDLETIQAAVTAAETGHLVLATMHTSDTVQTIERMVDAFPPHQQQQVRVQVAQTLEGIISQRLVPRTDGEGRVPVVEILRVTTAIRSLIRQGKTGQIGIHLETGGAREMQTFEKAFADLYSRGVISADEVLTQVSKQKGVMDLIKSQKGRIQDKDKAPAQSHTQASRVLNIQRDLVVYRAPTQPGDEVRWGSSGSVLVTQDGLQYTYKPLSQALKEFIADYSILTGYREPFNLTENVLINYKVISTRDEGADQAPKLHLELFTGSKSFTLPLTAAQTGGIPLETDGNWHSIVIHAPANLQGQPIKIYYIEFTGPVLRLIIGSVTFF
jgi:twitching motility protein PilT